MLYFHSKNDLLFHGVFPTNYPVGNAVNGFQALVISRYTIWGVTENFLDEPLQKEKKLGVEKSLRRAYAKIRNGNESHFEEEIRG